MNQARKARDAYEVLNVRCDAHQVVVRAAYRALAGLYHPDSNGAADAARLMSELNTAYAELRTPERRDVYDRIGSPAAVTPPSAAPTAGPPAARKRSSDTSAAVDFGAITAGRSPNWHSTIPITCAGSPVTHPASGIAARSPSILPPPSWLLRSLRAGRAGVGSDGEAVGGAAAEDDDVQSDCEAAAA